ncbi:hypothetical protein AB0F18_13285 [Streptomyces sp. NPDC029216]
MATISCCIVPFPARSAGITPPSMTMKARVRIRLPTGSGRAAG